MSRRTRSDRHATPPSTTSTPSGRGAQRGAAKRPAEVRSDPDRVEGEVLEPIGVVERELTRPDGTTVVVEVPVYPPFRLKERPAGRPPPPPRQRGAPSLRRRKTPRSSGNAR